MAKYQCRKCGETADSKCAASRHVFGDNQELTMTEQLTHIKIIEAGDPDKGVFSDGAIQVSFRTWLPDQDGKNGRTVEEAFEGLRHTLNLIHDKGPEFIKAYLCVHDWELISDRCELGCCTRGSS